MPFTIFGWVTITLFIIIIYLLFHFNTDWSVGECILATILPSIVTIFLWFGLVVSLAGYSGYDKQVTKKLYALTNTTNMVRKGMFVAADENYIIYCYVNSESRLITVKKHIEYVDIVLEENVVPHVTHDTRFFKLNKFGRLFFKDCVCRVPVIRHIVIHLNRQNVNNEIMYNINNF